jgi:hypothetical protein
MLRELVKIACLVVFLILAAGGALKWLEKRPNQREEVLRHVLPAVSLIFLAPFLDNHRCRDRAPDSLQRIAPRYFNRNDFCLAFEPDVVGGMYCLLTYFQNQRERACQAEVALRPARGLFTRRPPIETVRVVIDCPGGAFGLVRLPIPLPAELQGRRQAFEVGATVRYPEGRGGKLRYRWGTFLRTGADFRNHYNRVLTILAGLLTFSLIFTIRQAGVLVTLPTGVAEVLPSAWRPPVKILWEPGDPPLRRFDV